MNNQCRENLEKLALENNDITAQAEVSTNLWIFFDILVLVDSTEHLKVEQFCGCRSSSITW
jgi:hypothetical protein